MHQVIAAAAADVWNRDELDHPQVDLRVVGGFAVYRAGGLLPPAGIGSRKARTLLALLAVEPSRLVPVDRIMDVLWRHPPQHPIHNVATLVSRLRSSLGRDSIVGGIRGYQLARTVRVDLYAAATLVGTAEGQLARQPGPARHTAEEALRVLAVDTVLPDHPDADWLRAARTLHTALLRRARHAAASAALAVGCPAAAAETAQAAIETDPFDETAYRILMAAHDGAGEPARALHAYHQLRAVLDRELGIEPAAPTRDLHVAILRHNIAPTTAAPTERAPAPVTARIPRQVRR